MIANRNDLLLNILKTLRTFVTGTGDFYYKLTDDLTETDSNAKRVRVGSFVRPPLPVSGVYPFLSVFDAGCDSEGGPGTRTFSNTASFVIRGWVEGSPVDPQDRLANAARLEKDIKQAMYKNLQLRDSVSYPNGLVHRTELTSLTFDGAQVDDSAGQAEEDGNQFGIVVVTVTSYWEDDLPAQETP